MASLGFAWTPTMRIGSGCTFHLTDGELPTGRLVVAISNHYTAVIDGVIHTTPTIRNARLTGSLKASLTAGTLWRHA